MNPFIKLIPSVSNLNSLKYVFRFSFTPRVSVDNFLSLLYPSKYKFIANGLFFSFTLFVLFLRNFFNCSLTSSSFDFSLKDNARLVNSSNESGSSSIEAGELLSN